MYWIIVVAGWILFAWAAGVLGQTQRENPWLFLVLWVFIPVVAMYLASSGVARAWGEQRVRLVRGWILGITIALGVMCMMNSDKAFDDIGYRYIRGYFVYMKTDLGEDGEPFQRRLVTARGGIGKAQLSAMQFTTWALLVGLPWGVWRSYEKVIQVLQKAELENSRTELEA